MKKATNKAKWTEYRIIPEDVYESTIDDLKIVANPFKDGETQFQFHFKVSDGEGGDVVIVKSMSQKLNEKSSFYGLCSAVMGKRPNKEECPEGIDGEELIGKKVRVSIRHKAGGDGRTYMNIDSFLPSKA